MPDEDLAPLYSNADVFIYPSLYEGFGLPPLEAMQCGTPVVTSNTSSLPEVVGDAGFMVDPHDVDALSSATVQLLTDQKLAHDMGEKSLRRSSHFSWARCAENTFAAYQKSLR